MDKVGVLNFTDDDGSTYVIEISTFSDSEGDKKREKSVEEVQRPERKKYTCYCCGSQFPTLRGLRIHLKVHGEPRDSRPERKSVSQCEDINRPGTDNYFCYTCGFCTTTRGGLRGHVKLHMKPNEMVCSICGVTFTRRFHLKAHLKQHHLARHAEQLQQNVATVQDAREKTEIRQYSCDICDFTCTRANQFAGHMKTHPKDEPVFDYSRIRSKQIRVYSRVARIKQEPA